MASRSRQPRVKRQGKKIEQEKEKEEEGGGNMLESVKLSKGGAHRATGPGILHVVAIEEFAAFGATI